MKVITGDSRLYKLYSWIQHVDHQFSQKLIEYVSVRFDFKPVSVSISEILELYEITESEYAYQPTRNGIAHFHKPLLVPVPVWRSQTVTSLKSW